MKPTSPEGMRRKFPVTDYFFHTGMGEWRGYSSSSDDDSEGHRFNDFSRKFLVEAAEERAREMAVFAVVVVASAWPVIYMIITVVRLLRHGVPFNP
jgi:hypothetical protein